VWDHHGSNGSRVSQQTLKRARFTLRSSSIPGG
jgi:hypothetical protein